MKQVRSAATGNALALFVDSNNILSHSGKGQKSSGAGSTRPHLWCRQRFPVGKDDILHHNRGRLSNDFMDWVSIGSH